MMETAAHEHSNSPLVKLALGWARFRKGDPQQAVAFLEDAAAQLPGEPTSLYFLGVVLMELDREDDSMRVARKLQRVVDQPRLFVFRPDARRWLAKVSRQD